MAQTLTRVAPENAEQLRAWDGDEGDYWAQHADLFDAAVARHHARLLEAACVMTEDVVLDVGCGTGQTSRDAARRATGGSVLGVDLGARMLDRARETAAREGLRNVTFVQADAQVHRFEPGSFSLLLSRTGTMFFGDPPAAFANLAGALRPGGRTVQVAWQSMPANEWVSSFMRVMSAGRELPAPPANAPSPFALGDPERLRSLLETTGFVDVHLEDLREPMFFGRTADEATGFVGGLLAWMLEGLDEARRAEVHDDLRRLMAAHEGADGVVFGSRAWLVTARRG